MLKFLFYCFLLTLLYRWVTRPLPSNRQQSTPPKPKAKRSDLHDKSGEYVDFEEIKE